LPEAAEPLHAIEGSVVTVSQLFPVADVEEFTVSPQRQQLQEAEERRRTTRERSTVLRLVSSGEIPDGTPLRLRPTTEVTPEARAAIEAWVNQDPRRGRARWYNDPRQPLAWDYDGGRYRPTEIVRRILADAAGIQRSPRGPGGCWRTAETYQPWRACQSAAPSTGPSCTSPGGHSRRPLGNLWGAGRADRDRCAAAGSAHPTLPGLPERPSGTRCRRQTGSSP
jgi:hypothetical protein